MTEVQKCFPVMTEKQTADFLQVPESTLQRLRLDGGDCPPYRVLNGKVRYLRDAVEDWMRNHPKNGVIK